MFGFPTQSSTPPERNNTERVQLFTPKVGVTTSVALDPERVVLVRVPPKSDTPLAESPVMDSELVREIVILPVRVVPLLVVLARFITGRTVSLRIFRTTEIVFPATSV